MSKFEAAELFSVKGMVFVITGGGSGVYLKFSQFGYPIIIESDKTPGIGAMMANALDVNGAAKVYIVGRRLEKLQEVATGAVCPSVNLDIVQIQSSSRLTPPGEQIHNPFPRRYHVKRKSRCSRVQSEIRSRIRERCNSEFWHYRSRSERHA